MNEQQLLDDLRRKRKVAKQRIAEQFGDVIKREGIMTVDCGADLGTAVVIYEGGHHDIRWLKQEQVRTLAGRID